MTDTDSDMEHAKDIVRTEAEEENFSFDELESLEKEETQVIRLTRKIDGELYGTEILTSTDGGFDPEFTRLEAKSAIRRFRGLLSDD